MRGLDIVLAVAGGGRFGAYLAAPDSANGGGIVVLQEIFGVNQVMRDVADGYAADGYFAIVPDLFWRQEPGIQIADTTVAGWTRAVELYKGFDQDLGIGDAIVALDHLRGVRGCSGKVGSVGYCLGGKLAYLMATRSDTACAVGFYGVDIEEVLDEAANIANPLMLHIAENDVFAPAETQAAINAALDDKPLVTIHSYPGVDHAFARIGGAHFAEAEAALANRRTAEFFTTHLV